MKRYAGWAFFVLGVVFVSAIAGILLIHALAPLNVEGDWFRFGEDP